VANADFALADFTLLNSHGSFSRLAFRLRKALLFLLYMYICIGYYDSFRLSSLSQGLASSFPSASASMS
jgi:hypothetical protein